MGKVVALGGGRFDNGEMTNVVEHIVKLSGVKNPHFMFVPTASFDNVSADDNPIWDRFREFGCSYDELLLTDKALTQREIEEKINSADIIYADGGNLKFLSDVWFSVHADKLFRKAFDDGKVLCGHSSGSMCWFQRGYDDCGEDHSYMLVDTPGFLPYCNCPHYQSENWQTFGEAVKAQPLSGIACDNGAAICYVDGEYYTISGNEDGDCYFYDAEDNYRKINLRENPEKLRELKGV